MSHTTVTAARATLGNPAGLRTSVGRNIRGAAEWDDVGLRVAFLGGLWSLVLLSGVSLALVVYRAWLGDSLLSGPLIGIATFVATGLPFLLFICFLFSTVVTLPILGAVRWIAGVAGIRVSRAAVTAVGGGLVATVWTSLLAVAYMLMA